MSLSGKHIWVCPLNWGLGHASRCIPIIRALLDEGAKVYLASDGAAKDLLDKEFPNLPSLSLPDYRIQYGHRSAMGGVIRGLPTILRAIAQEQKVINQLLKEYPCDLILSDNRYGAFSTQVPSVLITHQLQLPVPSALQLFSNRILQHWFAKFQEIWVPDWPKEAALAGKLSVGRQKFKFRHLGILSRMANTKKSKQFDLLAVLSGPEPQRSLLETEILEQFESFARPCCLVRGTKTGKPLTPASDAIKIVDLAATSQLQELMGQSEMIICRSGYSSLMDLAQLEQSALIIPTPGQPEQEYLAEYHKAQGWWQVQTQNHLDLNEAWAKRKEMRAPNIAKMEVQAWVKACEELLNC